MSLSFPASPTVGQIYKGWIWDGTKWVVNTPAPPTSPTTRILTVGSGTYATPANVAYLEVTIIGGGGGGGGGGATGASGVVGGNSQFGGWIAGGGNFGGAGGAGPGGAPSGTTPTWAVVGGTGNSANNATSYATGGGGGNSSLGGAGGGGAPPSGAGYYAQTNTGSGGGGGAATSNASGNGGGGGGAGATVFVLITNPAASYSYLIGAAGTGGVNGAGGGPGGNGGSGVIIIVEHYNAVTVTAAAPATVIPKMLFGLEMANNSGSPNTEIDITTGGATSDDGTTLMTLSATGGISKTTAAWAAGSGSGGLDTGTVAANTWYHVFLIMRTDTGVVDVLISTNVSAPTMPASYNKKRRIGSILTDASSHILGFHQLGDQFLWNAAVSNFTNAGMTTSAAPYTLTVPTGVQVIAVFTVFVSLTGTALYYFFSPDAFISAQPAYTGNIAAPSGATGGWAATEFHIRTNTSAAVVAVANSAIANGVSINTLGWIDNRGK